ncbi:MULTISPECIES: hypothetical protein [Sphingomonas]|uniref:hypothetical protein n=1 Tax=Sphingomonas TaxID=13687 RepID=UPI00254B9F20|nr:MULTISPECIES: hypothetical protein [Sphingomonas]MDK8217624.1 hypothetical protein [Sphingomonas sp. UMB7805-LC452B]
MKKTTGLMAGASRFAHFAGLSRSTARRRAADDDQDEPKGKRGRASEDDEDEHADEDEPKGKRSHRASDDDDDDQDESEASDDDEDEPKGKRSRRASDDDDDDQGEPKGKRSRRASDDDDDTDAEDDEDELNGKSSAAGARRREQARIAHILGNKAAANNPALAVSLACTTRMSRHAAVRVLRDQPERDDERPHGRQSRSERNVTIGSDAGPRGKAKTDAGWARAFGKAGVKVLDR